MKNNLLLLLLTCMLIVTTSACVVVDNSAETASSVETVKDTNNTLEVSEKVEETSPFGESVESTSSVSEKQSTQVKPESRNEEIVIDPPITIINNEKVTVKVTRFFREVYNEGKDSEFVFAGFEVEAENKMEGYDISLDARDCSLSDRRVIEFSVAGNSMVAPGKIALIPFVRSEGDFDPLDSLYELEGNLDMTVSDNKYAYSDLSGKIPFSIPDAINGVDRG